MSARLATTLALAGALCTLPAFANDDGRQVDRAMRGCGTSTTCHGVSPGASARIEGPMRLDPGARGTYTLVITSTLGDFAAGGFNIAAAGATLAPNGAVSQLRSGQLTHVAPVARSGAEVRVPFDVVAPMTAGAAMLFAAGNAVNARSNSSNDAWAITSLSVAVGAEGVDAGAPVDAGVAADTGVAADAGPRTERYDPTASSAYGGCRAAPGRPRGAWAALALLGLAARRRRSR